MNIKQMGRTAEFYLEEAVLSVLMEAHAGGKCIGAAAISRRAGIYRDGGGGGAEIKSMNDAIVTGMLVKLHHAGKVERCPQTPKTGGWRITGQEYALRAAEPVA